MINGDDFFAIDNAFGGPVASYAAGDFDYNNKVNADDYWLIDSHYSKAQLAPALPAPAPAPAVGAEWSSVSIAAADLESSYKRLLDADADLAATA